MRERTELLGGRFELTSGPGIGTRIRALLPLSGLPSDEP
jgi:signal transduction histidine kinase